MPPSSPRWPLLILLIAVASVYWQVSGFGFVWDDHLLIAGNPLLDSPSRVVQFFQQDLWAMSAEPGAASGYYRPLFVFDLALTRSLGGPGPGAYHVHSLMWHLLAVFGVFTLLRRIVDVSWAAAAGAALFALHPVQVEAVSFISARNDLMATALMVWALVLLSRSRPSWPAVLGGAVLALAALLSKESVVLAPALLALIARARGPGWGSKRAHGALIGALAVGLGLRLGAGVGSPDQADLPHLWAALGPTFAHSADRLIWPVELAPMVHLGWPPPLPWLGAGLGLGLCAVLAWAGRRRAGLGLGFAVLTLLPALAGVAHTGLIVDRYLYLPMVGLGLMVSAALPRLGRRHVGFTLLAAAGLVLTAAHLPVWESDETLWKAALERAPSAYAAGAYGRWLEDEGRLDQAAKYYTMAVAPPRPFATGCYNITRVHLARGRPDVAILAGASALEAGCEASAELLAPLALAQALTGAWADAEATAASTGIDPTGKTRLVLLAAAARRGDRGPLQAELAAVGPAQAEALRRQVATLIAFSGEVENAGRVRAIPSQGSAP